MIIRRYTEKDKERVIGLLKLNIPGYFAPEEEQDLLRYLGSEADNYFLLESDGELLGCGGFNLSEDGRVAKIAWDFFHPSVQGKGFGSELTRYRIAKIKEIPTVKTLAVRTSQLAFGFYERFGLQVREIVPDYWAEGFDLYYMDANLDSLS